MTVRIRNLNPGPKTISVSFLVEGKNGKITNQAMSNLMRNRIKTTSTKHYRNALKQFSIVFRDSGVLSGTHGGARAVRFESGDGRPARILTKSWEALTRPYVRRAPLSTRVWHKRTVRSLSKKYDKHIHPERKKVSVLRTSINSTHRRGKVRAIYTIKFDKLPNRVVNTLIAAPFVQGSEAPATGFEAHNLNRNSSELMGYPEAADRIEYRWRLLRGKRRNGKPIRKKDIKSAARPFVARMSARLGKDMHTAIRKL